MYRIAELAEVSIGAVEPALHGRPGISEVTRKKALGIAKQLAYRGSYCDRICRSSEE